jgi:hypothetical protein
MRCEDESHLPVAEQSLVFRLYKRAEIRRSIPDRLAVKEGKPDKIANLLEEAAIEIQMLKATIAEIGKDTKERDRFQP